MKHKCKIKGCTFSHDYPASHQRSPSTAEDIVSAALAGVLGIFAILVVICLASL